MRDLRISVTDRCNFRCPYCMPRETYHDGYRFLKTAERLSFQEIVRLARLFVQFGVRKLRITASTDGTAELALLVRSDLKGKGLGSLLLDRLIARCRNRGLRMLTTVVLQGNTLMLRLAERCGFRREPAELGVTHLVFELDSLAA